MPPLTPDIVLTLSIAAGAVIVFASERLRADVVALLVLISLILTGLVSPANAFGSFASPAVVTVWAVYIVSGGLFRTGVAEILGERILGVAGRSEARLVVVTMIACGLLSAFMNNIGATAVLLPAAVGLSRRTGVPTSRLLIPLAFASLMGGNMTLIGTPPNILANGILMERGLVPFRFFDFAPTGIAVFAVGVAYMAVLGRRILPRREALDTQQGERLREYVSEVRVSPDSPIAGKSLVESRLGSEYDLTVLGIHRGETIRSWINRDTMVEAGDLLIVVGGAESLLRARRRLGLELEAERKVELDRLESSRARIVEATLAPGSPVAGRTLTEIRFRDRYGFTALAIYRHGEVLTSRLREVKLRFGDALLLQGPPDRTQLLRQDNAFLVLEDLEVPTIRRGRAAAAAGITVGALAVVAATRFDVATALVTAAVLMVLSRCLTMDEAYQSIDWRSVFLIAGMLPLGTAMENTGAARYLADLLIVGVGPWGPRALLGGIYVLVALLTQPMSNAAATVLIVPIAIDTALEIGASPHPFVLSAVIGASTSFLTPVGHQANVLVFGPGGYRFSDYTRVGAPLNLCLLATTVTVVPYFWPLFP